MEDDDTTRSGRTRRRIARWSVMPVRLLAVALLTRVAAAVDTDGDGVEDSFDVFCGTPPALTVAVEGRPFGDMQRDCDVDLGDFSLLALGVVLDEFAAPQRNFTGMLAPDGPRVPDWTGRIGARPQQTNFPETIPPNDNCSDAVGVGVGTGAFSNQNAGTDGPVVPPSCIVDGDNQVGSDIWFCHEAICTDTVVVSLCGSEYDTKMAVYEGCECPVDTPIACGDDGCGQGLGIPSRLTFAAEAGQSYLIRIGGFAGAQGTGLLTIFCESDPTSGIAACGDGAGDCFSANGSPACDDVACCEEVCGLDPYCCDVTWDDVCAARTEGICTRGMCGMDLRSRRLEGGDRSAFLPSFRDGIAASACDFPQPNGVLTCLLERHERDTTESDVAAFSLDDGSQHPAL